MDFAHYMTIFLDEGRENLQTVAEQLLQLEVTPDDPELVHTLFRAMHSFKGMASTMGFDGVTDLAHAIENLLDALREGAIEVQPGLIDVVLRCVDTLEAIVDRIEAGDSEEEPDVKLLVAELAAWQVHTRRVPVERPVAAPAEAAPSVLDDGPRKLYQIDIELDLACLMKSVRALMITSSLDPYGQVQSIRPSVEELEWPDSGDGFQILIASALSAERLQALVAEMGEVASVSVTTLAEVAPEAAEEAELVVSVPATAWRVDVELTPGCLMRGVRASVVLATLAEFGEVRETVPGAETLAAEAFDDRFSAVVVGPGPPAAIRERLLNVAEVASVHVEPAGGVPLASEPPVALTTRVPRAAEAEAPGFRPAIARLEENAGRRSATVRVSVERLDALLDLVGELLNDHARLSEQVAAHEAAHLASELGRTAHDIHDEVLALRMVPVESVFGRFPRLVRDLSRDLGKDVKLQLTGVDTPLDRRIADEIADALIHLVRNALDHGLETPEAREAAGKTPQGSLLLSAAQEGHEVLLTVADDGRGLSPEAIAAKALAKGLISPEEAAGLSRDEAVALIFRPGFSTAEATTTISGRGVGMDVVRAKVQALGGSIHVDSTPGLGTAFVIRLPMSLAVIPAMLTDIGGEVYGIPMSAVETVLPLGPHVNGHFELGDEQLPVVRLRDRFAVPAGAPEAPASVVVVRTAEARLALVVEALLGTREVAVKPLNRLFGAVPYLAGAATLGDGRVALMLDPRQL